MIALTPSQQIIAEASKGATLTDARGRSIEAKALTGREVSKFLRLCGPSASNSVWRDDTLLRATVRSLGGVPVPFPTSLDDLDDLWDTIDGDAVQAVADWLGTLNRPEDSLAAAGESIAPQA